MFTLVDKVAVVTGAGQGIGRAIALRLAEAGADIVVAERVAERAASTTEAAQAFGRRAIAVTADVRSAEEVDAMVRRVVDELGRVDILVNNVGGQFKAQFLEISESGWDAIIRVNLKSTFLCSQAVGKVMAAQRGGVIINIASMAAFSPNTLGSAYVTAKAGIVGLTRTLAWELGKLNIRVCAIAPGYISTEGAAGIEHTLFARDVSQERLARVALGRFGEPDDVANVALFLASDAASYVTGVTIPVDGMLLHAIDADPPA